MCVCGGGGGGGGGERERERGLDDLAIKPEEQFWYYMAWLGIESMLYSIQAKHLEDKAT